MTRVMKIDEAIKRLNKLPLPIKTVDDCDNHKAVQLGIEALKFKHEWDMGRIFDNNYLLSGETKG